MVDFKNRNKEIQELHKQGQSYIDLSKTFSISRTRVWQICSQYKPPTFVCKKHNRKYTKECNLCKIDSYYKDVLKQNGNLKEEIERLRNSNREKENVYRKEILIKQLRDTFNFSFRKIGQLLNCHYSSIIHLYNKGRK